MGWTHCRVTSGVALLLFLAAFSLAETSAPKCTTGFSVVAPEVAAPGKKTVVLVSLHGGQGYESTTDRRDTHPVNVTLRLETQESDGSVTLLAKASKLIDGHGIIPLSISPSAPSGQCTLHTEVDCAVDAGPDGNECAARGHSLMRVLGPVRDVIVRPARHDYRPGDTVTFWVLALDHDLRLVSDVLGSVSLMDPAGTKVSIWEEVRLDEGVKKFTVTLSDRATAGRWKIHASTSGVAGSGEGGEAAATVEVNVSLAGAAAGDKDTSAAEQHYVELRFGKGMRRQYKPGLPFFGRVEAVSTEPSIRVRVKLMDHSPVYSQDVDLEHGGGDFRIPAVYATSETLYLQAELVSVGSQQIESHYVLAREPITKWNSTSECYLLIEGLQMPLKVGETAQAVISSTCACGGGTALAAVTSGGRATHWGQRELPPAPHDKNVNGIPPFCSFNYSFPVLSEMAPVSQLLVYHVTDDGEPISDVATFHVQLLHKEVAVVLEERKFWYPRQGVNLRLLAEPGSTVCLIGGKSPTDAKFDPHVSEVATQPEFASSGGLDVVSAGVSLCERRGCGGAGGSALYRRRGPPTPRAAEALLGADPADRLWMWKCFNYTNQLSIDGLTISAPSKAGRWSVWALSLSTRSGLAVSAARPLIVFRPIQVDFEMPPALKVGETVEVDVKIGNNINTCLDVTALLSLSGGASFASNGLMYVTERLRLGPRGATSLVVRVAVATPGRKNITVEVTGYSAENCDVSYGIGNSTLVGSVVRSTSVLVQPEGLVNTDTESAYFCANEHLLISPPSQYEYSWVTSPRNRAGLVFEVRSQGTVRVALSDEAFPTDSMYYVVIESKSGFYIGRGSHLYNVRLARTEQPVALSSDSFTTYWVCWEGKTLSAGVGADLHQQQAVSWRMEHAHRVTHIGFASDWGSEAEFRIWNFNDEAGFSQVLELSLPRGVVPGSAQGSLLVAGGLVLPHVPGYHLPLRPPHSANPPTSLVDVAAGFAPLLALEYTPHLFNDSHHETIMENLPAQVQTLMSFLKSDNSFSDHYSLSSHLSTINVLEVLSKTQTYYPVDPGLLESVKRWVQTRQEGDGSFTPLAADIMLKYYGPETDRRGSAYNGFEEVDFATYDKARNMTKELQDLEQIVEITAETLITLMEIGVESEMDEEVISKSKIYLEKHLHNVTSSHPLAIMVYALVLSRSTLVPIALDRLSKASTTAEGEFGWPHADTDLPKRDAADWLYEEDAGRHLKTPILTSVEEYRASLFALLSRSALGDLRAAEPVARYLFYRSALLDRHPELLYTAVKAFSIFGALAYDKHRLLTVSLATAGMELTDTLRLEARGGGARVLQLPGLPTKVFVYATGAGCATLQGFITYSTYASSPDSAVLSVRSGVIEEVRPERSSLEELQGRLPHLNIKTCFKWKHPERSGALRLEISLFSGFELTSFNPVVLDEGSFAQLQHGSKNDFVWFAFANVSSICPVCITYQVRSRFIVSSLRPALARVWPAARPDLAATTFFHARGQAASSTGPAAGPTSSPLLRGITDDDYITWFGLTQEAYAARQRNDTVERLCECGRICRNTGENHEKWKEEKSTAKPQVESLKNVEIVTPEIFHTTESIQSPSKVTPTFPYKFNNQTKQQNNPKKINESHEHEQSPEDAKNVNLSSTSVPAANLAAITTNLEAAETTNKIENDQNTESSKVYIESQINPDPTLEMNHSTTINLMKTTVTTSMPQNSNLTEYAMKQNDAKTIIIPTAVLVGESVPTDNQTYSNIITPELKHSKTDELIVQKTLFKKEWYRNSDKKGKTNGKVNYPRKKGTLKATYGDKHEMFYKIVPKIDVAENFVGTVTTSTVLPISNISPSSHIVTPIKDQQTTEFTTSERRKQSEKSLPKDSSDDKFETISAIESIGTNFDHTTADPLFTENKIVQPSVILTTISDLTHESSLSTYADVEKNTDIDIDEASTTVSPMQTEIFSAIRSDKSSLNTNASQDIGSNVTNDNKRNHLLASTGSSRIQNIITASSTLSGIHTRSIQLENNLGTIMKNRTAAEKHGKFFSTVESPSKVSISKSVNKEIHQIPHAPFSETSQANAESVVLKKMPENRDGFVVLEKNELWDILKEVVHVEIDKNEERIQKELKTARNNTFSAEAPSL